MSESYPQYPENGWHDSGSLAYSMREIWGVIWTRDDVRPSDEVTWYSTKEEALSEYNNRGDKYWHCPLVKAAITPHHTAHTAPSPFEHGYDDFYYREDLP